jgi:hypothetical protein
MEDSTHVARFFFSGMIGLVPIVPGIPCSVSKTCNVLFIQGAEEFSAQNSNTSFDFSPLKFFSITLVAAPDVDFVDVIENGGDISVASSLTNFFVQSASDTILIPLQPVPEPNSLSVILFALAGVWFVRNRGSRHRTGRIAR